MSPNRAVLEGKEVEIVKLVFEGATPQQWAQWLRAPLEHAAASGNLNLVDRLLRAGANDLEGWRGCGGRTLLDAAASGGSTDVMSALLQAGCGPDVNIVADSTGRSALYQSIVGKNEAAARSLVMFGADVNFEDRADKAGPLIAAVKAGYDDLVRDLLIAGADPNARQNECGGTSLHAATERGLASTVSVLLSSPKTEKNARNNDGRPPLTTPSYLGRLETVRTLLAAGADVHIRAASDPMEAFWLANYLRRDCAVTAMGEHGIVATDGVFSILHATALMDNADCAAALVDAGADIDARSGHNDATPFLLAARAGSNGALLALLSRGASVAQTTNDGSTALHLAANGGEDMDDTVEILLRWGASEQTVDQHGKTPADVFTTLALQREGPWPELERALELFASAPAGRAWWRRCWLVMLRKRTEKERETSSVQAVVERAQKAGSGQRVTLGDRERGGNKKARRRGGRGRGRRGARAAIQAEFRGLVNVLVGLESEEVFRTIVGYI